MIGVEPAGAAAMKASIDAGHPSRCRARRTIADGLMPVRPGDLTFAHVQQFVDRVVTVDDPTIIEAVLWIFANAKIVAEPSGAATTAAVLSGALDAAVPVTVRSSPSSAAATWPPNGLHDRAEAARD